MKAKDTDSGKRNKESSTNPSPEGSFPTAPSSSELQYSDIFEGADSFLSLLLRQTARANQVVARSYGNGGWHQFSGRDFAAHVGRSSLNWLREFPLPTERKSRTLIFIGRNTYTSFVASLGAMLAGLDVMFLPSQAGTHDTSWCIKYFSAIGIATDIEELAPELGAHGLPVFNLSAAMWAPQDRHPEPPLFRLYRDSKTIPEVREAMLANEKKLTEAGWQLENEKPNPLWNNVSVGRVQFVSFGHDGFQKPEVLAPDALVVTAQNFVMHAGVPASILWKSLELLAPSNPFAHLSRFSVLTKNGVIGFPNEGADWETNLRILRPTVLFASPKELQRVTDFVETVAERSQFRSRILLSGRFEKGRDLLKSARALKLPELFFQEAKRALRVASRFSSGRDFVKEAVEDLRFVVHGLSPASEQSVQTLDRLGVPVVETYGVTAAAGMLSSNSYESPHFNLIGAPLPHVAFRLGANSVLEYRLSHQSFGAAGKWQETGDVAQMTPFGFAITGRQRYLFVTAGGVTVSPVRLEQLLKQHSPIIDSCIVGDRMPYLAALLVLDPEMMADYRQYPDKIKGQIQEIMGKVNETLPRNATIKKFHILEKPFSEVLGEKLPSGANNRLKILQTREETIMSLYL
jgi:long-chain acyl-CoA synthetase